MLTSSLQAQQPGPGSLLKAVPWIALLAAFAATWFSARGFPGGNNVYHLPIVLDYAGGAEGPHDAYHQTFDNFISFFWQGVALLATEGNVSSVFLGLLFLCSIATVLGGYGIAITAGASRNAAAIGAGFLAFAFAARDIMEFGGGELFSGFLTHSQFAAAVSLFAAALALRGRWRWAAFVCGCAADVNLFLGFWLTVNLLLARVAVGWREERRSLLIDCTWMSAITLVATAPTLIWALQTMAPSAGVEFSYTQFLYDTFPFHSFIHLEAWYSLAFVALTFSVWLALSKSREGETADPLATLIVTAAVTVLAGSFAVYLYDHRLLQNLFPLRYAAIAHWLAAIGVIVAWARAEKTSADNAAFGAIAVLGFILPTPAVTLMALFFLLDLPTGASRQRWLLLLGFAATLAVPAFSEGRVDLPKNIGIGPVPAFAMVCVTGSIILSLCRHRFSRDAWAPIILLWLTASTTLVAERAFAVPFILAVVGITAMLQRDGNRRVLLFLCVTVACLMAAYIALRSNFDKTVIGSLVLSLSPYFARRIPLLRRDLPSRAVLGASVLLLSVAGIAYGARLGFDFPKYPKDQNWFAAQNWARENTAPNTLFYAPARIGFSTLSRRPVWWDEDRYAAVMWSPEFFDEWSLRKARAEAAQTLDHLLLLARQEHIRYLVLEAAQMLTTKAAGLEQAYCNPDYCIAAVSDSSAVAGATRCRPCYGGDSAYTLNQSLWNTSRSDCRCDFTNMSRGSLGSNGPDAN